MAQFFLIRKCKWIRFFFAGFFYFCFLFICAGVPKWCSSHSKCKLGFALLKQAWFQVVLQVSLQDTSVFMLGVSTSLFSLYVNELMNPFLAFDIICEIIWTPPRSLFLYLALSPTGRDARRRCTDILRLIQWLPRQPYAVLFFLFIRGWKHEGVTRRTF